MPAEEVSKEFVQSVNALVTQLNSKDRAEVAKAYSRLSLIGEKASSIVTKGYSTANLRAKGMILRYLAEVQDKSSYGVLKDALENEEEAALRAMAARALLRLDPTNKDVLDNVSAAIVADPDEYFQIVVLNSLNDALSREIIPYMIGLMKEGAPQSVRRFACQSLRRCTRQKIACEFEGWDTWWTENQDIFIGCKNKKPVGPAPEAPGDLPE